MESDSPSDSTLEIKMGRYGFQCAHDVTYQWMPQRNVVLYTSTVNW